MKKTNKTFVFIILVALIALALVACNNDPDDSTTPLPQSVYSWTAGGNTYDLTITEKSKAITGGNYVLVIYNTSTKAILGTSTGTATNAEGDNISFTPSEGSVFTLKITGSGTSITVSVVGTPPTIGGITLAGGSGSESDETIASNPFKGSWSGIVNIMFSPHDGLMATLIFEDTTYQGIVSDADDGDYLVKGTYTYSGNTASFTTKEIKPGDSSSWGPPITDDAQNASPYYIPADFITNTAIVSGKILAANFGSVFVRN